MNGHGLCDPGHVRVKRRYRFGANGAPTCWSPRLSPSMEEAKLGVFQRAWRMAGRGRPLSFMAAVALASSLLVVSTKSVAAAALTNTSWTVSNNQAGATPVNYAYSFKTATTGTIKTITFVVSGAGLAGAPAIATAYGIGAGSVVRA